MAYSEYEESAYSGNPIELFEFLREDGLAWRFTSSDSFKTYNGKTFLSTPIKRGSIEMSQDVDRSSLEINVSGDETFIQQFVSEPPSVVITLTIRRYHLNDSQVFILWSGVLVNVEYRESTATILCESAHTGLRRNILRRRHQVLCPHILYGDSCLVDKTNFNITSVITNIDGFDVESTTYGSFEDGYFSGGYLEYSSEDTFFRRFITNHVGSIISLNLPLYNVPIGDSLSNYAGCDHTRETCNSRFSNILNYGGHPWIPNKNPTGGSSIF